MLIVVPLIVIVFYSKDVEGFVVLNLNFLLHW